MKHWFLIALSGVMLTGCPFDSSNDNASPSASASPNPSPTSSPTASATPSPSPNPSSSPSSSASPSPSPSASPSSTPATGASAAACFNPDLLTQGTRIVQTYKTVSTGGTVDFTDDRTVGGQATFEGETGTKTTGTTTSTTTSSQGSSTSTSDTTTYDRMNASIPQAEALGTETTSQSQIQGFTITTVNKNVIDPPRLDRFNLNQGDDYTQTFTVTSTVTVSGSSNTTTTQNEVTRTYVSRQTISVPAGTFETCNMQDFTTATVNGQSSTSVTDLYFGVGNGLLIKQENQDGSVTELQAATINGVSVR